MNSFLTYLTTLPEWLNVLIVLFILGFVFFLGSKIQSWLDNFKKKKLAQTLSKDNETVQKSLKKLWDAEKKDWKIKVEYLTKEKAELEKKINDYRKKLSGFGRTTFISREKKEFFYNLLIENETLEQLLKKELEKSNKDQKVLSKDKIALMENKEKFLNQMMGDPSIKDIIKKKLKDFPEKISYKKK